MRKLLTALLLWPAISSAQEVKPVESAAYLSYIYGDTAKPTDARRIDTSNDIRRSGLKIAPGYYYNGSAVKKIITKNNTIKFRLAEKEYIAIGGNITLNSEWLFPGRQPALQNDYTQGRSVNGSIKWRGQETAEEYSYGPAISSLEFDGNNYYWDTNGRLVPAGTGNGKKAIAYNNSVLQNGFLFSPSLTLYARYYQGYKSIARLTLRGGKRDGQTIIPGNHNRSGYFSSMLGVTLSKWEFSSQYNYRQLSFTHPNRNGFVNRFYQQSLLSPVSLNTKQNLLSAAASENHRYREYEHSSAWSAEYKINRIRIKIAPALDIFNRNSRENYRPGSLFYPSEINVERNSRDKHFTLNSSISSYYPLRIDSKFWIGFAAGSIYNDQSSLIDYSKQGRIYDYQRRSHNISLSVSPEFRIASTDIGLNLGNKSYSSSTGSFSFFLPGFSGFIRFNNYRRLQIKIFGAYQRFISEPALNYSYAGYSLTQLPVAEAVHFLPLQEAISFKDLAVNRHKEINAGIEIIAWPYFQLTANWFNRNVQDDVFPYLKGGQIQLMNMASHRNRGIEIELKQSYLKKDEELKLVFSNQLSFAAYRNRVTKIKEGFNGHPIAGFSDLHKAIVKDQPLGVIMGNSWLRNAQGEMIIGNDGFPLVNNTLTVIADPNPDFTIKLSQQFTLKKKWSLNIDWEWRNGGETWNGTAAMLDHYGISAASVEQRNISGYIFPGRNSSGAHNSIPVNFYDSSLPFEQNRWVRYGPAGVAEGYIQKADCLRFSNISLQYKPKLKNTIRQLSFSVYASNLLIWSPYKGVDTRQLLFDQPGSSGLDLFNLPAVVTAGFTTSFQF